MAMVSTTHRTHRTHRYQGTIVALMAMVLGIKTLIEEAQCHLGWRSLLKCNKTNHACLPEELLHENINPPRIERIERIDTL